MDARARGARRRRGRRANEGRGLGAALVVVTCALLGTGTPAGGIAVDVDVTSGASVGAGDALEVRAVVEGGGGSTAARATCALGWGAERTTEMRYDGNDDRGRMRFTGWCDTNGAAEGERVRVKVSVAAGTERATSAWRGAALERRVKEETPLPILHVWTPDYDKITTDAGERVALYFEDRYYDDVFMRRRGSNRKEAVIGVELSAANWPKRKFKLDFGRRRFKLNANMSRVSEINLNSHYQEPGEETYMRENLGFAILRRAGVPAPLTRHVHVRVNNEYYGLWSLIEQVDERFLKRNNLFTGDGYSLYKAVNWKYSNLRAGDPSLPCPYATPDYRREWMNDGCPEIYRKASKPRDKWDDLWQLTNDVIERVRRNPEGEAYLLFDHLNLPSLVNEMAAQTLMLGADRCTKNYYMHRDWTGEWTRIPWDVEDIFPSDKRYGTSLCKPSECAATANLYCILSCEKFNSPLYCDRNHPQDIFYWDGSRPEQDPRSTYNVLIDVMLSVWPVKEMYLTRLRTLMDQILATSFVDDYVRRKVNLIRKDALRDSKKWGVGAGRAIDQGVNNLLDVIVPTRRKQLFEQYSYMIPPSIPSNARVYVSHAQRSGDESYVKLSNPNGFAVDVSDWIVSTPGGWTWTLKPGSVMGPGRVLFVVKNAKEFRNRATWARREYPQGVFVQGNFYRDLDVDDPRMFTVKPARL